MAGVRIYALAKELGLDNKQLLDICENCGIKGKGSALASLDDNEIATIRKFMTEGPADKPEKEAPAPRPHPGQSGKRLRPRRCGMMIWSRGGRTSWI